jgi:Holliday junction resolvase RusA-like endonuclease
MLKKKSITILIAVALIVSSMVSTAFAEVDKFPVKYGEPIEVMEETTTTQQDIDNTIKAIEDDFNKSKLPKIDQAQIQQNTEKAIKLLDKLNGTKSKNDKNDQLITATGTYYDQNKAKLRAANFMEGVLDLDEGLTSTEIYKIGVTYANQARDAALKEFPSNVMLQDAFRHFSWNYISTGGVGALKTRTATINHEWGILILEPVTNYYTNRYNTYRSQGYSDYNAANKAFSDAVAYIPDLKYQLVTICKSSYSFFKSFFTVSNIMDLHNNCYGRAYYGKMPNAGYKTAFYTAKNKGELILSESSVGDYQYKYVWQSQWYTY